MIDSRDMVRTFRATELLPSFTGQGSSCLGIKGAPRWSRWAGNWQRNNVAGLYYSKEPRKRLAMKLSRRDTQATKGSNRTAKLTLQRRTAHGRGDGMHLTAGNIDMGW
jgi:hypothetical protein